MVISSHSRLSCAPPGDLRRLDPQVVGSESQYSPLNPCGCTVYPQANEQLRIAPAPLAGSSPSQVKNCSEGSSSLRTPQSEQIEKNEIDVSANVDPWKRKTLLTLGMFAIAIEHVWISDQMNRWGGCKGVFKLVDTSSFDFANSRLGTNRALCLQQRVSIGTTRKPSVSAESQKHFAQNGNV